MNRRSPTRTPVLSFVFILALFCALFGQSPAAGTALHEQPRQLVQDRLLRHNQTPTVEQRRVALVIGNGAFQNVKSLKNHKNAENDRRKVRELEKEATKP